MPSDWRKSSFSENTGGQGGCVTLRRDLAAIRDSKQQDGPIVAVPIQAVRALRRYVS